MVWNGTVPIRVHQTSKTEADAQARVGNPPEEAEVERLKQEVDDLGETLPIARGPFLSLGPLCDVNPLFQYFCYVSSPLSLYRHLDFE